MWPTPLTCRRRTSCGWSSRSRRLARPWRVVLRQLRLLPQRRLPLWLIPVSVLLRPQRSQTSRWWTCRWRSCQRSQRTLSRKMLGSSRWSSWTTSTSSMTSRCCSTQCATKMSLSSKFGVLIDAQTSRLKINLDYMEAVRDFLAATAVGRYSVCVVIGHRTD